MNFDDKRDSKPEAAVFDLSAFRKKKQTDDELAHGRKPLYVSHLQGKVQGEEHLKQDPDFGDRLTRIRSSLDKINRLMSELKKMSSSDPKSETTIDRRK